MQDLFESLQHQKDTIDEELIYLLYRRQEISRQMHLCNPELDTPALQNRSLQIMLEEAQDKGVDPVIVKQINSVI